MFGSGASAPNDGGAGGGGWYGGGTTGGSQTIPSSASGSDCNGGAGGSGYVYTSSTSGNYPSGCLLNSNYYLIDAQTIAGDVAFPDTTFNGTTETGHEGHGYARIITRGKKAEMYKIKVKPTYNDTLRDTICAGQVYIYEDSVYTLSGDYTHSRNSVLGCDSITVLRLFVKDTFHTERYDTICRSEIFNYGNGLMTYRPTNASMYDTTILYVHTAFNGCDSNVVVNLHVNDTFRDIHNDTICRSAVYSGHGLTYTPIRVSDTVLINRLSSVHGCDSTIEIRLHINDTAHRDTNITICRNGSFVYGNNLINYTPNRTNFSDTLIIYTHQTATGCDSNIYFHVHVNDTFRTFINATICRNETYTYTGNNGNSISYTPNRTGFNDTTILTVNRTIHGCDSTIEIRLHINDTAHRDTNITICRNEAFVYGNNLINYTPNRTNFSDTLIIYTHTTATGCDSNIYFHVHINDTAHRDTNITICRNGSFVYGNNLINYTPNRTNFTDTLIIYTHQTATGCDSNIYFHVHVSDTAHRDTNITICRNGSFVYGNNLINYTPNRTNFTDTLIIYTHQTVAGCDSNIYFHVHVNDTFYRDTNITICRDGSFVYGNNLINYTPNRTNFSDTLIIYTHQTAAGCDSNIYFHVHVSDTFRTTRYDTICRNEIFVYGNNLITYRPTNVRLYDTTMIYLHQTVSNCDSNVVIRLHINDTFRDIVYDTICRSVIYSNHGLTYIPTANIHDTVLINRITSRTGCDSTIEIRLHVNDTARYVEYDTICRSDFFYRYGLYIAPTATVTDTMRLRRIILPSGCDSVVEVHVHVNDTFRNIVHDTICRGDVYVGHGITCTPSANVSDSILINRLSTVFGCDSVIELHLHVKDTFRTYRYDTICAGSAFIYERLSFSTSQTIVYTHTAQSGCDSNVVVNLFVSDTIRDTVYRTICSGATFDTLGQSFYLQGVHTLHMRLSSGCYNNLVIVLNVNDTIRDTIENRISAGQTWTVNTETYSLDGWYRQTFQTRAGCDSILHLHLIVSDTITDTLFYSVCAGRTITVNDSVYSRTGWYRQQLRTPNGSDSILFINLIVEDTLREHLFDTICSGDTLYFNGTGYMATGVYRYQTSTQEGCDSIAILHLQVNDTIAVHVYDTLCVNGTYNFFGTILERTGTYYHHLPRVNSGCDSTIAFHLYIRDSIRTVLYDTICNNSTFTFGDTIVANTGRYWRKLRSYTGCDSLVCLNLTVLDYPTLALTVSGGNCKGDSVIISAQTNANYITWSSFPTDSSLFGQEHNMTVSVTPTRYTEYIATVDIQPYNCNSSEVISLSKPTPLEARMSVNPLPITTDNLQTTFTDVSVGNVVSRQWSFHEDDITAADRFSTDSIARYTPTLESDSLEVVLMVTNDLGCHDTLTKVFPIYKGDIWVPNAFTPGTQGTGNNYLFRVGHNNVTEYEIHIYSRAGLLVFHSTDPDMSWDGTHNYKDCVGGSYVYIIRYQTNKHPGQTFEKKGSVMLIR